MGDDGDEDATEGLPEDLLLVTGKTDEAYTVVRRRGDRVELGAIRELSEGKPIHGEIVKLRRREEHPLLFDVDVLADTSRSGPAKVANHAYRAGWEAAFGKGEAN